MKDIVYDRATISDTEQLVQLRIDYMIDDFGHVTEQEEKCMREQLPDYYARHLGKELIVFTARDGEQIVGTAYLLIIEKPASPLLENGLDGEVLSVFTKKDYRGRGICTTLMEDLVAYAVDNGLCRVDLMATDEGYPVYRKVGFTDKTQKYTDMRYKIR